MAGDACHRLFFTQEDKDEPLLIFQDEIRKYHNPALAFFELANASVVAYKLGCDNNTNNDKEDDSAVSLRRRQPTLIRIRQNSQAQTHTGGVVWETSYLLLGYLLSEQRPLGHMVELGAGCGLLGIALAAAARAEKVTLTEVDLVLPLLRDNLKGNQMLLDRQHSTALANCRAIALDWTKYTEDAATAGIAAQSADTIVGTDVVFAPALVEPLWKSIDFLAHAQTIIYLCVQIRCAVSHQLLLDKASDYGFEMKDLIHTQKEDEDSAEIAETTIDTIPIWAKEMECFLFRIQHTTQKSAKESDAAGINPSCPTKKRQKKQKN